MTDLHWNLRGHLKDFRTDGRLFVLLSIYLHKNTRNRAWPSNDLIANETGLSRAPISRSIKWLADNHAVMIVPFDKRIGDEKKLPNRKNIYQLTGVIRINDTYRPYMYMTPEGWAGVIQELTDLGNSSLVELLNTDDSLQIERLPSERLPSEPKGIKGIKGIKGNSLSPSGDADASKPSKKERKPNPIFDVVCEVVFGIDPATVTEEDGGRIGAIAAWLNGKSDGMKRNGGKVGYISRAAEPDHVRRFAGWYKSAHPNISMPRDFIKFVEYWREWATAAKPTQSRQPAPITQFAEPTADELAELAAARKAHRPEWEKVS